MIDFLLGVPGKLKTIADYLAANLSTGRTAKIDNLDAAITTRAAATDVTLKATWTDAKAVFVDAAISSRLGGIKSIQQSFASMGVGVDAVAVTLGAAVNVNKCMLLHQGSQSTSSSISDIMATVVLSSSTQVTVIRGTSGVTANINFTVIEFF